MLFDILCHEHESLNPALCLPLTHKRKGEASGTDTTPDHGSLTQEVVATFFHDVQRGRDPAAPLLSQRVRTRVLGWIMDLAQAVVRVASHHLCEMVILGTLLHSA